MERPGALFSTKETVAGLRSRCSASTFRLTRRAVAGGEDVFLGIVVRSATSLADEFHSVERKRMLDIKISACLTSFGTPKSQDNAVLAHRCFLDHSRPPITVFVKRRQPP